MGLGIIVPGYLQIREFELQEAKSYVLDRSSRMHEQVEHRIQVLKKAGVLDIPSYVHESKGDMLREFEAMEPDPRVVRLVLDERTVRLFDDVGDMTLENYSSFLRRANRSEEAFLRYEASDQDWLASVQKQEEWGWYIVSMMCEQEIYKDSKAYLIYVAGVGVLVFFMVLGLSILLTRQLRLHGGSILELLKRYSDGDYEERLRVTGPAELGDLQVGINSMIDNIEMEILSRKSVEEALNSARLQAEEINLAKAEYVRDMNHQVQNAMNSASGFSELLLKTDLGPKQKKYVNNVLAANQSLNSLVSDMLALSGIEVEKEDEWNESINRTKLDSLHLDFGELNILLVAVDPLNCAYLTEIMGRHGVTPFAVPDEAAAVKHLEEEDADLIVLDIDHSKLGGEEAITYMYDNMTAYAGSIPILIMTSIADNQTMARYRRMGVTSIRKPFSATKLVKVMREIFRAQESEA